MSDIKLPYSPYLYREAVSPTEWRTQTMYTVEHLEAYAEARAKQAAELARQDDAGYQRGLALAASICRHYAYGLHCQVSGSTPDAIDAVSTCAKLIDEQLDRARGSDK